MVFIGICKLFLEKTRNTNTQITAINILVHTNGNASKEINLPKTAVNPQMKTMKCNCK